MTLVAITVPTRPHPTRFSVFFKMFETLIALITHYNQHTQKACAER